MGYVLEPEFWEHEANSVLLERNDYVTRDNAQACCDEFRDVYDLISEDFCARWAAACRATPSKPKAEEFARIFEQDAIRTFNSEEYRAAHVDTLCVIFSVLKDYHQGVGFLAAFFRLFLRRSEAVMLVLFLSEHCCEGFYKLQNAAYLRDCKIFDCLLGERQPRLAAHLARHVVSGQYLSKFWIGMGLHVLPLSFMIRLLGALVAIPEKETLYCFSLCLLECLEPQLLQLVQTQKILELLRFAKLSADALAEESPEHALFCEIFEKLDCATIDESALARAAEKVDAEMRAAQRQMEECEEEYSYTADELSDSDTS